MRLGFARLNTLYNRSDEMAKGRSVMLFEAATTNVLQWLTSGLFYTGFLMLYGVDLVNIGIITFVPYIAACFGVFSPSILERFPKRRWLLAGGRLVYYTLNILVITVLPGLVANPTLRLWLIVGCVFTANVANALFSSGYSVWHVHFIPESIRAEYFSTTSAIVNFVSISISLCSALLADALKSSPYHAVILIGVRYFAYALGLINVFVLTRPKEYPYPRTESAPRLGHILQKPFRHPRFALTMLIVFLYTFFNSVPMSSLNYYLINGVGVGYTLINLINLAYPFILVLFMPLARRLIRAHGWFSTFAVAVLLLTPTSLMYSCVTSQNYLWLLPMLRILQHLIGVVQNISYANMPFINLPDSDQTNYIAFHLLVVNGATFLGMMTGTTFVGLIGDDAVHLFGMAFTGVQMLLWAEAFGEMLVPALVLLLLRRLTPPQTYP